MPLNECKNYKSCIFAVELVHDRYADISVNKHTRVRTMRRKGHHILPYIQIHNYQCIHILHNNASMLFNFNITKDKTLQQQVLVWQNTFDFTHTRYDITKVCSSNEVYKIHILAFSYIMWGVGLNNTTNSRLSLC